ncbi:SMI1/KNR4 family protein [Xanthomonas campestris pv. badrii]|uniref:SMI1/KNR4 family protein n=1 Tax=Xanthomonas campestris pv. badrii TaxID=149696 RepID=A0A7Z2V9X6_XANCA|nr:SMI1/KNR4 family protein [Xanthomonas campestris]QJD67774.1 SMI1/KNR4 family protein [Xanthomonas campestris pv. badrii]
MLEGIRAQLRRVAPDIANALLPPASEAQLAALESALGQAVPADLATLYRESAGLDPDATANFARALSLMSVDEVLDAVTRDQNTEPVAARFADKGIRPVMATGRQRIVIGTDFARCCLCVDLIPGVGGTAGQIVFLDSEHAVALLLAPSMSEFARQFESDLANGKYTLAADALEDGVQWLQAAREIDVCNWYSSPTWTYVGRSLGEVSGPRPGPESVFT